MEPASAFAHESPSTLRGNAGQDLPQVPAFIADQVKQFILDGELKIGDPVTEKWLTSRFNASRTTVRDALALLVAERYLEHEPYRSARVRSYSPREVKEILDARMVVESHAAENCTGATAEARREVQRIFAEYTALAMSGDQQAASMAHVELHVALVGLTGNATLQRIERDLMIGSLLFVELVNRSLADAEKMCLVHMRIVNAFLDPDPELAIQLTREHLEMVQGAVGVRMAGEPSDDND